MALKRGNVARQEDVPAFDPTEVDDAPFDADEIVNASNDTDIEDETVNETAQEVVENTAQAVAVASPKAVAAAGPVPTGNLTQSMEEMGFKGLDFGFGAFPIITLDDGQFMSNDVELGEQFDCYIQSSCEKILYRTNVGQNEKPELVYTYDDQITTKGEQVADVLNDWRSAGQTYQRKVYLDVIVEMCGDNELAGQLAVLSIPPQSTTRFSGYLAQVVRLKRKTPQEVVTTVYRGRKVTGTRFPWFPWAFKLAD